jgi:threonine/homoserine/homoserine lactone efflux protein
LICGQDHSPSRFRVRLDRNQAGTIEALISPDNRLWSHLVSLSAFALAVLLLLVTPGPTNTLLAVSGASRGLKASLPLIGAELGGYLSVVIPLVFLAAPVLVEQPAAALAVKLASTLWVLMLAARLWMSPPSTGTSGAATCATVYCTTLLNPKGLIVGLTLIPAVPSSAAETLIEPMAYFAVFAVLVVMVAIGWLSFGAAVLRRMAATNPLLFGRLAASFLAVFAISLGGRAIGWI